MAASWFNVNIVNAFAFALNARCISKNAHKKVSSSLLVCKISYFKSDILMGIGVRFCRCYIYNFISLFLSFSISLSFYLSFFLSVKNVDLNNRNCDHFTNFTCCWIVKRIYITCTENLLDRFKISWSIKNPTNQQK